jgi:hypothetical protein
MRGIVLYMLGVVADRVTADPSCMLSKITNKSEIKLRLEEENRRMSFGCAATG